MVPGPVDLDPLARLALDAHRGAGDLHPRTVRVGEPLVGVQHPAAVTAACPMPLSASRLSCADGLPAAYGVVST